MAKFTLGVYGIYAGPSGTSAPTFDLDAMFDPAYKYSFLRYWCDVTAGTRDIEATVHPWRNIGTNQNDIDKLDGLVPIAPLGDTRSIGVTHAARYLATKFPKSLPSSFDGLVIFTSTSQLTGQLASPAAAGGATGALIDDQGYPAAYLNLGASFNFYVHEIGHVLGYDHSSGPLHSVDQWGTYDDPVDAMSSARYGATDPTFRIPNTARRFPHTLLWGDNADHLGAGPGLSPAQLWRYCASRDAMAKFTAPDMAWVQKLPPAASPTLVTLYRAGMPNRTTLVAIPSTDAYPSWTTFEYRPATGWDRGLGSGPGLVRPNLERPHPGVVVHRILRDDGAPNDGPVDRVNYRHTVTVPGGDQDWTDGRTGVRVIDHSPDAVLLLVGRRLPTLHEAKLTLAPKIVLPLVLPGDLVPVSGVGHSCGTREFRLVHRENGYDVTATAEYSGFASAVVQWAVNGVTVPGWIDPTTPSPAPVGLTITVPVKVPVSKGTPATITKQIDVVVGFDKHKAIVSVPRGDGEWTLSVTARVAEGAHIPQALATVTADAVLTTFSLRLPKEAIEAQGACLARIADEARQLPPDELTIVNPKFIREFVKDHQFTELAPVFKSLFELSLTMPFAASRLVADVADELDVSSEDVRRIGKALTELPTARVGQWVSARR